jgi:hypothetical protein
MIMTA